MELILNTCNHRKRKLVWSRNWCSGCNIFTIDCYPILFSEENNLLEIFHAPFRSLRLINISIADQISGVRQSFWAKERLSSSEQYATSRKIEWSPIRKNCFAPTFLPEPSWLLAFFTGCQIPVTGELQCSPSFISPPHLPGKFFVISPIISHVVLVSSTNSAATRFVRICSPTHFHYQSTFPC